MLKITGTKQSDSTLKNINTRYKVTTEDFCKKLRTYLPTAAAHHSRRPKLEDLDPDRSEPPCFPACCCCTACCSSRSEQRSSYRESRRCVYRPGSNQHSFSSSWRVLEYFCNVSVNINNILILLLIYKVPYISGHIRVGSMIPAR